MAKKDYNKLARDVLIAVGGEKNIKQVIHCATRLRFNLVAEVKDKSIVENIPGVLGTMKVGEQFLKVLKLN